MFHENAFEVMINLLHDNPNIDLVYSDFNVVDLEGNFIMHQVKEEPDTLRFHNSVGACFLYKKSLADRIGSYDPQLFLAEDYEFWIRAYLYGNLYHISETLYDYCWHEKSLTSTRKNEVTKATFLAKNKHFNALLEKCNSQEEKNTFFWEMLSSLTNKREYRHYQKIYYKLDILFSKADRKKRINDFIIKLNSIRYHCHIKHNNI